MSNAMSQALVVSILTKWQPMIESVVAYCEQNLIQVKITTECLQMLIANNSYKHMCMLINARVSVTDALIDILDANPTKMNKSALLTANQLI